MLINNNFYVEVAYSSHREMGQMVCGSEFLTKGDSGNITAVLCSGGGSGSKSNIIAGVMCSMALTHIIHTPSIIDVAKTVLSTFGRPNDNSTPSITLIRISNKAEVSIIEYGNPLALVFEGDRSKEIEKEEISVKTNDGNVLLLHLSRFSAKVEDRVLFYSSGVVKSGYATSDMPKGWGDDNIVNFIKNLIKSDKKLSAMSLSNKIVDKSQENDFNYPKNDICCGSLYFRQPRKLMVCTGPPYNKQNDVVIAKMVKNFDGDVIVSGGSTSQIISRELGRELVSVPKRDMSGLPSTYTMDGIKMVTEGVLTLGRVKSVLDSLKTARAKGEGTDIRFINELLEHDTIDFVVGTKINELHQNPNIPIELELRRSVVNEIARILETKYMKDVTKRYF